MIRAWTLALLLAAPLAAADPAIGPLPGLNLAEDFPLHTVELAGIAGDGPLAVSARSSDLAVLPDPYVVYTSPSATGRLLLAAAADASGSATVTVTVSGSGGRQASAAFTVTVAPVNDPPRFGVPAAVAIDEDSAGSLVITGLAPGPGSELGQSLRVLAAPEDAGLLVVDGVDHAPGATTATVRFHPVADAHGATALVVSAIDDGGTAGGGVDAAARSVPVAIAPVNDPPVLERLAVLDAGVGGAAFILRSQLRAGDVDGDAITWRVVDAPAHGALFRLLAPLAAGATFTQDDIGLGRIWYQHDGSAGAGDAFRLDWSDGVGANPWGPATMTVAVAGSSRPAVALFPGTASWTEGGAAVAVAPEAVVVDGDSPDLLLGYFTAAIAEGLRAGDELSFADDGSGPDRVEVSNGRVIVGNRFLGVVLDGSDGSGGRPLVVGFQSSNATPATAQVLARALRFRNATRNPGAARRTITLSVDDGDSGPSLPAGVQVAVVPVDDPPTVPAQAVALAAGIARRVVLAAEDDQDAPALRWTLGAVPAGLSAVLLDAAAGRLELRASPGVNGVLPLAVTVSDGVNPPVAATLAVTVTAATAPRPHPAGELPGQAFRGERLAVAIPWDCRLVPGAVLDFTLVGDPPPGLTVEAADATTATLLWTVPDDEPLSHRSFTLLAIDRASNACGALPALLPIRERPRGSN